jgi:predicted Zn-dependent protease
MKDRIFFVTVMMLFLCVIFVLPCSAQHREYYVYGKVLSDDGRPLDNVVVDIREITSGKEFSAKTSEKGDFKFIGLSHGIYKIEMKKEGFETYTDEWKFQTRQSRLQKVDLKTITLVAVKTAKAVERSAETSNEVKDVTEKIREKDFDGALVLLDKMLKEKPDNTNAIYLTGVCYFNKKMIPEAIQRFIKVTELTPSFPGAYFQLGLCYMQTGEKDKALAIYEKGLVLQPDHFVALYNSGLIHYENNHTEEALGYFERALKVEPASPVMLEMAGLCYLQKEDYARAQEYLEKAKAATTDPEKIKSLDELINGLKDLK